jgi:hypothetical protein
MRAIERAARLAAAGLALALALHAAAGVACGVCLEDKVASCYDHAVVTAALDRGEQVAFFAIQGPVVRDADTLRGVMRAIEAARGVRKGSARVSLDNAALSFAFDPARTSAIRAQEEISRRLARRRLDLALLKVLDGRPLPPPAAGLR